MTAFLGKCGGSALLPILEKVARVNPQALLHPLRVSSDSYTYTNDGCADIQQIQDLMGKVKSPVVGKFIIELDKLTEPEHKFKDWLENITVTMYNLANCYKQDAEYPRGSA